jgi:hypothetical protein
MNFVARKLAFSHPASANNVDRADADPAPGEQPWIYAVYLKYTIVFWLLGVLTPCAVIVLFKLVADKWPRGRMINIVVFGWLSIAIAQASSSILNGILIGDLALGLRNSLSFSVIGWLFGALAIAAGSSWSLANSRIAKLTAYLGGYILLLAVVAVLARFAGFSELRTTMTPLGLLLPSGNAASFYTSLVIFQREDTLGEATTRLILFFPWATALGLGGIGIALISTRVNNAKWCTIGFIGGLIGVVFSWSRLAIAAMALILVILLFLRLPRYLQIVAVGFCGLALYIATLFGLDPISIIDDVHDAADRARAGSSLARELIYQKSWEGFLASPIIGNGWIGESVHRVENLPIGSHSTFYGLLYTGGLITMGCFIFAMSATLLAILYSLWQKRRDQAFYRNGIIGLCLFFSLIAFCPYESLFSLTLPGIFILTWIGGAILTALPVAPVETMNMPAEDGTKFGTRLAGQRVFVPKVSAKRPNRQRERKSVFVRRKNDEGIDR